MPRTPVSPTPVGRPSTPGAVRKRTALLVAAALVATALVAVPGPASSAPGADAKSPGTDSRAVAAAATDHLLATDPGRIHRSARDAFHRQRVVVGGRGLHYVTYERTYAGLPVHGGGFVVTTDAAGRVRRVSMSQSAPLLVSTTPTLPAGKAVTVALDHTRAELAAAVASTPTLAVLADGTGQLTYEVVVAGERDDRPSRLHVLVDAHEGRVLRQWDEVHAAVGSSFYHGEVTIDTTRSATLYAMSDPQRPGLRCGGLDGRTYTGPDDVWGNGISDNRETACVDAMYAAAGGWDMLSTWLERSGYDGNGRGFGMRVGLNMVNAFWNGSYVALGHNGVDTIRQHLTMTDVVTHELGHGIFQHSGATATNEEVGGMNESSADIFGALAEWYLNEGAMHDPPDYLVGEEGGLRDPNGAPMLIRNMVDPTVMGDPGCYSTSVHWMESHKAAGVQNHWFYLLAEGSNANDPDHGRPNSPTCNGATVAGIGIQRAGQIFMETLNRKVPVWDWRAARRASLEAALDVFPTECLMFDRVRAAWDAVSVPPVEGEPASCR